MRIRHTLAVSIGLKVGIVLLCVSLVWAQRTLGSDYFNSSLSEAQMQQAVQNAQDVDAYSQFGYTGLMQAASDGRLPLAKALVKNGAHLNLQSRKGSYVGIANKIVGLTALQIGANNLRISGSKQIAYFLIDSFADPRIVDEKKNTALHLIISTDTASDRMNMARALVENGALINAQNFQGDALIHLAVNLQDGPWIKTLAKEFGPLIDFDLKNKKGYTPLAYAEHLGFGDVADALRELKIKMPGAADYNPIGLTGLMLAVMKGDRKLINQMAGQSKALNLTSRDQYKNSALHIALLFARMNALKTLLDKGASPRIKNARGFIPLQFVPRVPDVSQRMQAANMLIAKAPDSILSKNNKGENLIHTIVRLDDQQLLDGLIEKYRPLVRQAVLAKSNKLQSPLQLASLMRRKKIATRLRQVRRNTRALKK